MKNLFIIIRTVEFIFRLLYMYKIVWSIICGFVGINNTVLFIKIEIIFHILLSLFGKICLMSNFNNTWIKISDKTYDNHTRNTYQHPYEKNTSLLLKTSTLIEHMTIFTCQILKFIHIRVYFKFDTLKNEHCMHFLEIFLWKLYFF